MLNFSNFENNEIDGGGKFDDVEVRTLGGGVTSETHRSVQGGRDNIEVWR